MFDRFGFSGLLSEDEYFSDYKNIVNKKPKIDFNLKDIDKVEMLKLEDGEFYLLTSKYSDTLNSQFKNNDFAYIHPNLGFKDNQEVTISSKYGSIKIKVKNDKNIFNKAILLYAGNKMVNILTPFAKSDYGNNAVFQEIKVKICSNSKP